MIYYYSGIYKTYIISDIQLLRYMYKWYTTTQVYISDIQLIRYISDIQLLRYIKVIFNYSGICISDIPSIEYLFIEFVLLNQCVYYSDYRLQLVTCNPKVWKPYITKSRWILLSYSSCIWSTSIYTRHLAMAHTTCTIGRSLSER